MSIRLHEKPILSYFNGYQAHEIARSDNGAWKVYDTVFEGDNLCGKHPKEATTAYAIRGSTNPRLCPQSYYIHKYVVPDFGNVYTLRWTHHVPNSLDVISMQCPLVYTVEQLEASMPGTHKITNLDSWVKRFSLSPLPGYLHEFLIRCVLPKYDDYNHPDWAINQA